MRCFKSNLLIFLFFVLSPSQSLMAAQLHDVHDVNNVHNDQPSASRSHEPRDSSNEFYLPNSNIDVQDYHVEMWLPDLTSLIHQSNLNKKNSIYFESTLNIKALKKITTLELHSKKESTHILKITLNSLKSQNTRLDYHFINDYRLVIELPEELAPDDEFEIKIFYQILSKELKTQTGLSLQNYFGHPLLNVQNWPYWTRNWLPSNDAPQDPARFHIRMHIPDGLTGVSIGKIFMGDLENGSGLDADGFRVFEWIESVPIPTYGFNVAVGEFNNYESKLEFADKNLDFLVFFSKDHFKKTNRDSIFQTLKEGIKSAEFFSEKLGEYTFKKIGFVDAPQEFMMEYPGLITGLESSVHELAHHWFGNSVWIEHWGELWISEGFASYLDFLYQESLESSKRFYLSRSKTHLNHSKNTDVLMYFDSTPYSKGASALHDLRTKLSHACGFRAKIQKHVLILDVIKNLYQNFKQKHLGTQKLVSHLRKSLQNTLQKNNCFVDSKSIQSLIKEWKNQWFEDIY